MDAGIKMRWEIILRNYLEYLSEKYGDKDIGEKFRYIIENLDNNRFRNRVLIHDNEVVAYSFLVPSRYRDRDIANIGFTDKKFCNEIRSKDLVNWVLLNSSRMYTVLDDVFNDSGEAEKALSGMNFKKIVRKKMCIETGILNDLNVNIKCSSYEEANLPELCDAEFKAFEGTDDSFLLPYYHEDRVKNMIETIHGEDTEIIPSASFVSNVPVIKGAIIAVREKHTGAIFISDLFVDKNNQNTGIGKNLLYRSLSALSSLGYKEACLYISETNPAVGFFKKLGFRDMDRDGYTIYVRRN